MKTNDYKNELLKAFIRLGVKRSDVVCIASNIEKLIFSAVKQYGISVNQALDMFVDCLQEHVGNEGTILFQAFSWEFCRTGYYDYRKTESEVGAFSNWILENRIDFKRTKHAIYSFLVWGKDQDLLCEMDNQDAWGELSPFEYLHRVKAKQMLIDIEACRGMTFLHYIEQKNHVPYRYPKFFCGKYIDRDIKEEIRVYSMRVRDLDSTVELILKNDYLIKADCAYNIEMMTSNVVIVDLYKAFLVVSEDLKYSCGSNTINQKIVWNKGTNQKYEIGNQTILSSQV